MADVRKMIIASMLEVVYNVLDRIMRGPVCEVKRLLETKCGAMVLGSYISFLLAKDLYLVHRAAAETSLSIRGLYGASKGVEITTNGATSKHSNSIYSHPGCFKEYDFLMRLKKVYQMKTPAVLESHMRHMAEQAKK